MAALSTFWPINRIQVAAPAPRKLQGVAGTTGGSEAPAAAGQCLTGTIGAPTVTDQMPLHPPPDPGKPTTYQTQEVPS